LVISLTCALSRWINHQIAVETTDSCGARPLVCRDIGRDRRRLRVDARTNAPFADD